MIILNLELDNIYGFEQFELNLTYPRKVVDSIIENEHLQGRERFRYKKAVVLMGTNATGKTSLGKALFRIFDFIATANPAVLYDMVSSESSSFSMDFVNEGYTLHRLSAHIYTSDKQVFFRYENAEIDKMDSYETCVRKLVDRTAEVQANNPYGIKQAVGPFVSRFAYPEIKNALNLNGIEKPHLLKVMRAVIGTLDPTLTDISISKDLKDTFIIKRKGAEIIIQDGKLLNRDVLSSGTAEGIDVAVFLAAIDTIAPGFYYCDEHFSYIQSNIECRIFGMMLDRLSDDSQLIFTTHNTDMLDLNLPKHSYVFLRKLPEGDEYRISTISAADLLKRNTDSVRNAVENDVFSSLPDDSLLDELEMGWANGQQ